MATALTTFVFGYIQAVERVDHPAVRRFGIVAAPFTTTSKEVVENEMGWRICIVLFIACSKCFLVGK